MELMRWHSLRFQAEAGSSILEEVIEVALAGGGEPEGTASSGVIQVVSQAVHTNAGNQRKRTA